MAVWRFSFPFLIHYSGQKMENRKPQHQSKKSANLHPLDMTTSTATTTSDRTATADIADEPPHFLSPSAIFRTASTQSQRQVGFDHPSPPDSPASSLAETDRASLGETVPGRMHEFSAPFGVRRVSTMAGRKATNETTDMREKLKSDIKRSEFLSMLYEAYGKISPSLVLVNKGSVARDHLSNERTYLAWLRTSLSIITVGVAITQLFRLESSEPNAKSTTAYAGRPLGGSFIALGILFLLFAVLRFFHAQATLADGKFPASRGTVIIGTVCLMGVMIAMFVVVIIIS